jgi:chromate reductase
MRILAISGSLRYESHNSRLLRAAAEMLPPGVELIPLDGLELVPPYNEDRDGDEAPRAVRRLREQIAAADAVLIATPEYNASVPGLLKNAVDWASRPLDENAFRRKPVLVIGASTGIFGAVWAQAELRKVLAHIGAEVADSELAVGQAHLTLSDESWRSSQLAATLREQLQTLVATGRVERTPEPEPAAA